MSISSISTNSRPASQSDDGWQQFAQLVRALNGGDLGAAQTAYDKFSQSPAASLATSHPNSRVAQAMDHIGVALQGGDIAKAQQALVSINQRVRPQTWPPQASPPQASTSPVAAPSIAPADPASPGMVLNVTV